MSYLTNFLATQEGQAGDPYSSISTTEQQSSYNHMTGQTTYTDVARSPDDIFADITRAQALDVERRFYPLQDLNAATVMDPQRNAELHSQALGIVDSSVNNSFDRAEGRMETLRSRSNTSLRPDEKESYDRQSGVSKTAAQVQARNATRSHLRERDNEILMGSQ